MHNLHVYTNSPRILFMHTQTLHVDSPCIHKLSVSALQAYTNSPCIHRLSCCFIINIYLPAQTVWCFDISVDYTDTDFVVILPPAFVSPINFPLPCSTTTRSPCPGARPWAQTCIRDGHSWESPERQGSATLPREGRACCQAAQASGAWRPLPCRSSHAAGRGYRAASLWEAHCPVWSSAPWGASPVAPEAHPLTVSPDAQESPGHQQREALVHQGMNKTHQQMQHTNYYFSCWEEQWTCCCMDMYICTLQVFIVISSSNTVTIFLSWRCSMSQHNTQCKVLVCQRTRQHATKKTWLASSWILTSCQLHSVIWGRTNMIVSPDTSETSQIQKYNTAQRACFH